MAKHYKLDKKIDALHAIAFGNQSYQEVADKMKIPIKTLQRWYTQRKEIFEKYEVESKLRTPNILAQTKYKLAEKTLFVLHTMDNKKIQDAPLNQLATTLSALVGQLGKLDSFIQQDKENQNDHDNTQHTEWNIEYINPDGTIQNAPRWTAGDTQYLRTLQSRQLRATLGQDDSGHGDSDANSDRRGQRLVAYPNQRDSRSGVEELEVERESADGYQNQQYG